jgi:hypothetical protein
MALSAQSAPPRFTVVPQAPVVRPETERALRELVKSHSQEETAVCSIPLREVLVAKNVERMPTFRPRAEPDNPDKMDHMPSVKLPAPPCKEEKR